MADLAKLVVRLEAQSAQLLTELEKVNGKLARFEKNAGATLSKIEGKFSKFGFGVKAALGTFLSGVTFSAIIKQTEEAAGRFAILENAVTRAGDAAGGRTAREFAEVASELSNITTEGSGAIQGVQGLLLRFQNIRTDKFDDATKSVLDLSAALGKDLQSSAELVGKALSNPEKGIAALTKAGIGFTDAEQKVIKSLVDTGRTAEAQGIILGKLEKRFGGAAEAARNNFSGALKGVQNALGDLMEADGGLEQATESLNQLAKVLQDPAVRDAADALFSVIVRGAAAAAQFIGETIAGLTVLLGYGKNEAVNLDNRIRQTEEFLQYLKTNNPFPDDFGKKQIEETTEKLRVLREEYDKLMGIGVAGSSLARGKPKAVDSAGEVLPDITAYEGATDAADKLREKLEAQGRALTEKLQTPMERYNASVAEADRLLREGVISLDTWARALGAARGELGSLETGILDVEERFKSLDTMIQEAGDANVKELTDNAIEGMEDDFKEVGKELEKQLEDQDKKVSVFAEQAARNTQDILANGLRTALHEGVEEGADGALDAFLKMLEEMALQAAAANIAGLIFGEDGQGGGWLDSLKGIFSGGGGGGGAGYAQGDDVLTSILGQVATNWAGGVSWFDNGGRVDAGVPVAIGRGAQPELFVPDVPGEMYPAGTWGAGGGVTQNIYTSSPITERTARQMELEASRRQRTAAARMGL